ncbi:MAG TPA: glycosyltransferase family 39 protein [Chloroflexia bacterium]|nr:glycosyltransferase family 39 protein [Chloroflexia bacterium]
MLSRLSHAIRSLWGWTLSRPGLVLGALVLVGFALRVGWLVASGGLFAPPQEDELDYNELAKSLLSGRGYSLDGQPQVNRSPGYPVLLFLVYSVFGVQPAVARLVQVALLVAVVPLLYYVGSRGWSRSVGMLAAHVFAFHPFSIFWSRYLATENLLVFVYAVLAALLVCPERAGAWRLLAGGGVLGVALLTRPTAILVAVGLVLWLLLVSRGRGRLVRPALLLAGALVALSPWVARNFAEYGQFIPLTSGYGSSAGGYVFWISNNEFTARPGERWGRYVPAEMLPDYAEYISHTGNPGLLDRKGYEYGLRYLTSHPQDVPVLLLGTFLRFWNVFPGSTLLTRTAGATTLILLPFFLVGLWACWRNRHSGGMVLVFIVGTMLIGLIFWADTRIRAPAEPFIVLAAAIGAVWWAGRKAERRMKIDEPLPAPPEQEGSG